MQAAVETAASIIALITAQLVFGRFRRSLQLRDLTLSAALFTLAVTNLVFGATPAVVTDGSPAISTWPPVVGRLAGATLLAVAAFLPDRLVRHPRRTPRVWSTLSVGLLAASAVAAAVLGDALPDAVPPGVSPEQSARPLIVGHPAVLSLQAINMLLYAAAAVGFTRRVLRTGYPLLEWLAVGAAVAVFARLNYFLFPRSTASGSTPATSSG